MSLARLRTGEWIAGVAGVVLLVVLFLPWYQHTACLTVSSVSTAGHAKCFGIGSQINAWDAFSVTDLFLAAAAIAGILAAVLTAANTKPDAPITWEAGSLLIVFIVVLLAVYRLIDPPDTLQRCYGAYLGLVAALAVLFGVWLGLRDESAAPG